LTPARIVNAAARRFRSRGAEGAAITDLMRDLRLTHGGFYRHFDSKDDLFAEALEHAVRQVSERLAAAVDKAPPGGELKALIETYLSVEHCHDVANGCPVAALITEVARRRDGTRTAFQQAVKAHIQSMGRYVPGETQDERERKTITLFSGRAGTLNVARAIADDRSRRRVLEDARAFISRRLAASYFLGAIR
jgi:TetR/AcrR family transcriptional regulator, transcriptional repressor for nem operon